MTPEKHTSPYMSHRANLGETTRASLWRFAKYLTPRVPPFNVTQGHWNQHGSIGYLFLLVSIVTMGLSRIFSKIYTAFSAKSRKIFSPRVFNAPTEGVSFGVF